MHWHRVVILRIYPRAVISIALLITISSTSNFIHLKEAYGQNATSLTDLDSRLDKVEEQQKGQQSTTNIMTAAISAVATFAVGAWAFLTYRKNKVIDYEFKAHERIYNECYPHLFKFIRACEGWPAKFDDIRRHALEKGDIVCENNCKRVRFGDLDPNNYFKQNVFYRLFAPISAFKILEEKLTSVDLNYDPYLKTQYELGKTLYYSLSKDNHFHNIIKRNTHYNYEGREQGLRGHEIEKLSEFFIHRGTDDESRLKTFVEFVSHYENLTQSINVVQSEIQRLNIIFQDFDPSKFKKPILWRILLYHTLLCETICQFDKNSKDLKANKRSLLVRIFSKNNPNPEKDAYQEAEKMLGTGHYQGYFIKDGKCASTTTELDDSNALEQIRCLLYEELHARAMEQEHRLLSEDESKSSADNTSSVSRKITRIGHYDPP
jgi:hypothetical protein